MIEIIAQAITAASVDNWTKQSWNHERNFKVHIHSASFRQWVAACAFTNNKRVRDYTDIFEECVDGLVASKRVTYINNGVVLPLSPFTFNEKMMKAKFPYIWNLRVSAPDIGWDAFKVLIKECIDTYMVFERLNDRPFNNMQQEQLYDALSEKMIFKDTYDIDTRRISAMMGLLTIENGHLCTKCHISHPFFMIL